MGIMNFLRKALPCSRKAPKPALDSSPVLIAVVGCTGTGISTFIDAITDSEPKRASPGGGIKAHTPAIYPVPVKIEGMRPDPVVLVDTPGIDFANGPDFKTTFSNLNKWKNDNYGKGASFTGIVFMHRQVNQSLQDGEPSIQHSGILRDLCGANWKDKVVLVHNYQEITDHGTAFQSPEELLEVENGWDKGLWGFIARADKFQRFDFNDSRKSAWKVLWSLIKGSPNDLGNKLTTMIRDQGPPQTDRLQDIYKALQEVI